MAKQSNAGTATGSTSTASSASAGRAARVGAGTLPLVNNTGATFNTEHLIRNQQVVAVNRNELEDILAFDASALNFGGLGTFFASGGSWLFLEGFFTLGKGAAWTPLMWVCALSVVVGLFLFAQASIMHKRKRSKIERIFAETKPANSATASGALAGRTDSTP